MGHDQRVQMLMKGLAQMDGGVGGGEGEREGERERDEIARRGENDPHRRIREESRGRGGGGGERPPPAHMGGTNQTLPFLTHTIT